MANGGEKNGKVTMPWWALLALMSAFGGTGSAVTAFAGKGGDAVVPTVITDSLARHDTRISTNEREIRAVEARLMQRLAETAAAIDRIDRHVAQINNGVLELLKEKNR